MTLEGSSFVSSCHHRLPRGAWRWQKTGSDIQTETRMLEASEFLLSSRGFFRKILRAGEFRRAIHPFADVPRDYIHFYTFLNIFNIEIEKMSSYTDLNIEHLSVIRYSDSARSQARIAGNGHTDRQSHFFLTQSSQLRHCQQSKGYFIM